MLLEACLFNIGEGLFWIMIAGYILSPLYKYSFKFCLGSSLLLFALSDFVEVYTGAWWEPWWLLVWKSVNVAVIILLVIKVYKRYKSGL